MVWLKFAISVVVIFLAGRQVAKYGDIIAEKTRLGGTFIGAVLVAITTSLPELFTGISAAALAKVPDITVGNLFGANMYNLFNLALLDIAHRGGPLLAVASSGHGLIAGFSLILVTLAAAAIILSDTPVNLAIGWIGIYTPMLFLLYLMMTKTLFTKKASTQNNGALAKYEAVSLQRAYLYYGIAAAFVIGVGMWLAFIGKEIADVTKLQQSFIGSLFIAFTTTLPEITVSFSALRLGAVDLCVGNMIGSNLFNMTIIGVADLFYLEGPILAAVSEGNLFTAWVVIAMTGIFIAGLASRPQRKFFGLSWYALALILVFLLGTLINYQLGAGQ